MKYWDFTLWTGIDGLWTDIDGLWTGIDGLWTDIDGLWTDIDGLRTDIDGLWTDLDGLWTDIDGLWTDIDGMPESELGDGSSASPGAAALDRVRGTRGHLQKTTFNPKLYRSDNPPPFYFSQTGTYL